LFILATFANTTIDQQDIDFEAVAALYIGVVNPAGLNDSCNNAATGATFWTANSGEDRGVTIPYVNLTAGWNYTIVFSSQEGYTGYWGVQVIPTRIRFFTSTPPFTQPSRGDYATDPCSASSYTGAGWFSTLFTATQQAYLLDTQDAPSPFGYVDTYSFLYSGNNLGSAAAAPTTCPLIGSLVIGGDTGDVTPVYAFTTPGVNYTVVVSTYGGGTFDNTYATTLWFLTGLPIGALPPVTTGTPTTGAPTPVTATGTTSPSPTVAPTPTATGGTGTTSPVPTATGQATATTGATTNAPVATTSSASSVAVGVVAVVAVLASLL